MFWGPVLKDQLLQLIFSLCDIMSNSKTQINALQNMITLLPNAHSSWGLRLFTLELLETETNLYGLKARFQWKPQKSESPKKLDIAADSTNIELIPLTSGTCLVDLKTLLLIMDSHIVIFTTNDPINIPVPNWDLLIL